MARSPPSCGGRVVLARVLARHRQVAPEARRAPAGPSSDLPLSRAVQRGRCAEKPGFLVPCLDPPALGRPRRPLHNRRLCKLGVSSRVVCHGCRVVEPLSGCPVRRCPRSGRPTKRAQSTEIRRSGVGGDRFSLFRKPFEDEMVSDSRFAASRDGALPRTARVLGEPTGLMVHKNPASRPSHSKKNRRSRILRSSMLFMPSQASAGVRPSRW